MSMDQSLKDVDDYIAGYTGEVQERLAAIRKTVREAAPDAAETIKYTMPTYVLEGNLFSFGAYKRHIGFYPIPDVSRHAALEKEVAVYRAAKSTLQFPFDRPVPYELIGKLVKIRVEQNLAKAEGKKKM